VLELARAPKDIKLAALVASEAEGEATIFLRDVAKQHATVNPPTSQPQGMKL
jgi:hypothetical protein